MTRAGLGCILALAAYGCGSEFSAQPSSDPHSEAGGGGGAGSAMVTMDAASSLDAAALDRDASSVVPVELDAAKDQVGEASAPCPGRGGPSGVRVGNYCIDSTEVTNAQYAAFLADPAAQMMNKQPAFCSWNTDFFPVMDWPVAATRLNFPVVHVDWCDAYAFCQWAGKRMCGKIGGGSNLFDDFTRPTLSQWHRACTKGGTQRFPYGANLDTAACNITETGLDRAVEVKQMPCQGGYPGIFDMVGNVEEWEDACNGATGSGDSCRVRGLSYRFGAPDQGCLLDDQDTRSSTFPDLGIRCCSD